MWQAVTAQRMKVGETGRQFQLITEGTRVHLTDRDTQFPDYTLTIAVENVLASLENCIWVV